MPEDAISNILAQYDAQKQQYQDFTRRCEALLTELLTEEGYRVHSVTSRSKRRDRLEEKLNRDGKAYKDLSEVTDCAGVRVITHFEDEVDKIGTLVEREFQIDRERSIDKRRLLDPDRFGYLSLHYICSLHGERLKLLENRRYSGFKCEIQIRSILQHAWAEIEHDLGYKSNTTIIVPAPIRRRFSRLAGLLEMADQEFESIRNELANYAARVEQEIRTEPSQVEIDDVSLAAFVRTDELCRRLDETMAKLLGLNILPPVLNLQYLADQLRYAGVLTIGDLREGLETDQGIVVCQFSLRTKELPPFTQSLSRGISVLHFIQVRLGRLGKAALVDFYTKFSFGDPSMSREEAAQAVVSALEHCIQENAL